MRVLAGVICAALLALSGCAMRPIDSPLEHADHSWGYRYRFEMPVGTLPDRENLIILAFSRWRHACGGVFVYGVLEALRDFEYLDGQDARFHPLKDVGVIAGVSGGSFTALAYGLYGDRLFGRYEQQFLKRDVEGELFRRLLNPFYWGSLWSTGWGRSELAANYYDEILFELRPGPGGRAVGQEPGLFTSSTRTPASRAFCVTPLSWAGTWNRRATSRC